MKKLRRRLSLTLHSKRSSTHTSAAGGGVGNAVGGISRSRTLSEDRLDYLSDIAERQLTIDDLANALTEQDEEGEDDTIDLDAPERNTQSEGKPDPHNSSKKHPHHHQLHQKEPHSQQQQHQHHHQQQQQYYYYHSHQRFRPLSSAGSGGGLHQQQFQPYHHSQPHLNKLRVSSLSSAASLQEGDLADLTEDSSPLSGSADVLSPFRANGEYKSLL
ncbi:hypothetical protein ElyMa_001860700 [Elysia marginata]|uniref:Uncharacterized protein n=1 Tax=Elysia marginata TaxID=1093978 RepID=A0AAV4EMR3_9GAST|nr:hypothetical protein ElyMa_001860700 [Elysia marginata]